jgi:hypothetical protein
MEGTKTGSEDVACIQLTRVMFCGHSSYLRMQFLDRLSDYAKFCWGLFISLWFI